MRWIVTLALRYRLATVGLVLALAATGVYAVTQLPFDAYPDLTGNTVEISAVAPGMAAEDVEQLVTYPLETALMGLPNAGTVRSTSKFGLSQISVPFPDNVDVYFARTLVQQRLNDAKPSLPSGIDPLLGPVASPMGELYQYVVESDSLSLTELKTLHDYVIRPRLRTVPGVSDVNS